VPGSTTPLSGASTAANPGGGSFYAVSDQAGPGTEAISQTFTVPPGTVQLLLSFEMFVDDPSGAGPIVDPAGLDHSGPPNQHARVDLLAPGSPPFDTGPRVLANYYLGVDAGSLPNPYASYLFDPTRATSSTSRALRLPVGPTCSVSRGRRTNSS